MFSILTINTKTLIAHTVHAGKTLKSAKALFNYGSTHLEDLKYTHLYLLEVIDGGSSKIIEHIPPHKDIAAEMIAFEVE